MSNYIHYKMMDVITYSCHNLSQLNHVREVAPEVQSLYLVDIFNPKHSE